MPAFSKEELTMLLECLELAAHCPTHGEEATRICNDCTCLFCEGCFPGPCSRGLCRKASNADTGGAITNWRQYYGYGTDNTKRS